MVRKKLTKRGVGEGKKTGRGMVMRVGSNGHMADGKLHICRSSRGFFLLWFLTAVLCEENKLRILSSGYLVHLIFDKK